MGKFNFAQLVEQEVKFDDGLEGKKILIYGDNDAGKTYQACHFPYPLLIMTESGGSAVNCPKYDCTERFSTFKEIVEDVCKNVDKYRNPSEDNKARLQTIIIDTAENLVKLSEKAICNEFGVRDLSEITGKQNGYNLARNDFQLQINKLTSKGYTVVFIAHEEKVNSDGDKDGEKDFIQPHGTSNEKSSMRLLRNLVDFCIYTKVNGVDEDFKTNPSTAICKRTKNIFARSRFDIDTIVNPFTADNIIKAIKDAVKRSAENEGAAIGIAEVAKPKTKEDYFELIKPYVQRLLPICGDELNQICEEEFGVAGKKITQATDDDIVALDNIYNRYVTKAILLGIEV